MSEEPEIDEVMIAEEKKAQAEVEAQRKALLQKRRLEEEENERARSQLEQDRIDAERRAEEDTKRTEEEKKRREEFEAAEKIRIAAEGERQQREAEAAEQKRHEKVERKVKEEAAKKAKQEAEEQEAETRRRGKAARRAKQEAAAAAAAGTSTPAPAESDPLPEMLSGEFIASEAYAGSRAGYTYRSGDHGAGYYQIPVEPDPPAPVTVPTPVPASPSSLRVATSNPPTKRTTSFAAFLHEDGPSAAGSSAPAPIPAPAAALAAKAKSAAAPLVTAATPVEERIAKLKAAGPPKKVKPENRHIKKLLLALVPITKMEPWEIDSEMNTFKQHRIKTLEHLLILIGHKDYWTKLELAVVTKCAIEEALTHPRVREVGEPKLKIKALRAAIRAGEVVVPTSDILIAEMESAAPPAKPRARSDSSSSSSSSDSQPPTPKGASPVALAPAPAVAKSSPVKQKRDKSGATTTVAPPRRARALIISLTVGALLVGGAAVFLVPELRAMLHLQG